MHRLHSAAPELPCYSHSHTLLLMLDKFKSRKAPLSLSSVSNAIKNISSSDLSPPLNPKHMKILAGDHMGLPLDSILAFAYDPVQSLFAVSTFKNSVHVFGQNAVEVVFEMKAKGTILYLKFVKGIYLVCVEASGNVTVLSLHSKKILATYLAPGAVTAVECDPSMDWLILGLANGSVFFYDVDRGNLAPLRLDNLQKVVMPKQKLSPVLSIQWHPRDVGVLLICYSHCAVQYSIQQGGIRNTFVYKLTPECKGFQFSNDYETGGKKKLFGSAKEVICLVREAHYHPNGLHVATLHGNGTLVFWDANDTTLLQARTISETNLHKPGPPYISTEACGNITMKWVCGQDPELTQVIIAGASSSMPDTLNVLELGFTLKYSLTSHEKQAEFYARPSEGQRTIPVKFNRRSQELGSQEYISLILPIPADYQPYFAGGHNPSELLLVSSFGALYHTHYDSKKLHSLPLRLPPSLTTIVPPSTFSCVQSVNKVDWFGSILLKRNNAMNHHALVSGGLPVSRNFPKTLGADDNMIDVLVTGHEDGTVRCLDVTSSDHQREEKGFEFSLKETLDNNTGSSAYSVRKVSFAFECQHVMVGLTNGNVAICKIGKTSPSSVSPSGASYEDCKTLHSNGDLSLLELSKRVCGDFSLSLFTPHYLLKTGSRDVITSLNMSNAGFAAIAYKSGRLVVCDIVRGPAIILNLDSVTLHLPSVTEDCYVTAMEFAIMEYGQDGYSSLMLLAGTSAGGNFLIFKIVPLGNGGFEVIFANKTLGLNYKNADSTGISCLEKIMPVNASTGESAVATMETFQRLGQNVMIPGLVVTSSSRDLRVLKTPKQKLSHKVVDETVLCSGIVTIKREGAVLASVTKSGFVKLFSLPALNDMADVKIPSEVFSRLNPSLENGNATLSDVLNSGEIFIKVSPTEILNLFLYDTNKNKTYKEKPTDVIFNETAIIPQRPVVGAMLWAKGQSSLTSAKDLNLLVGGPNRKVTKNAESNIAYNISPEANPNHSYGMGALLGKARAEKNAYEEPRKKGASSNPYDFKTLGLMRNIRDGLDVMEESINNAANGLSESMTETVDSGKKTMYSLAFKSKFGF